MIDTTTTLERPAPSTDLTPAARAVLALGSTRAETELRALVSLSEGLTAVADDAGRDQVHRAAMQLRTARTNLEKKGKAARDDAQSFSKAVIAEEKRLIAIVQPEEQRLLVIRDEWDDRKAAQERARVESHEKRLAQLQGLRLIPADALTKTPSELEGAIAKLVGYAIDPAVWEEFSKRAETVKLEIIGELQSYLVQAKDRETLKASLREMAILLQAQQAEQEREAAQRRALWLEEQAKTDPAPIPMQPVTRETMDDIAQEVPADPAPAEPAAAAEPPSATVVTVAQPTGPNLSGAPALKLAELCAVLGVSLTAGDLLDLGFAHHSGENSRNAKLYRADQVQAIGKAVKARIDSGIAKWAAAVSA
ncbi:hypothetical protein [Ideonella livida]|uniref:Uncharacterized protein n=1 Tax=Ideonella livida TaxID=2707176 RepID=A0A7C9TIU6_9BURK|nr:hypothetical protein [Ideonella livida]NDY89767.1 hypothetical protein [Ideonella livida]